MRCNRESHSIPRALLKTLEAEFGADGWYEASDHDPSVFHWSNQPVSDAEVACDPGGLKWWRVHIYDSCGWSDELRYLTAEERALLIVDD